MCTPLMSCTDCNFIFLQIVKYKSFRVSSLFYRLLHVLVAWLKPSGCRRLFKRQFFVLLSYGAQKTNYLKLFFLLPPPKDWLYRFLQQTTCSSSSRQADKTFCLRKASLIHTVWILTVCLYFKTIFNKKNMNLRFLIQISKSECL